MGFGDAFPVDVVSRTRTLYALGNSISCHVLGPVMEGLRGLVAAAAPSQDGSG